MFIIIESFLPCVYSKSFKFTIGTPIEVIQNLVIGIGLLMNKAGKVLIDQRQNNQFMAGLWEFPGGKKEPGESVEHAIIRELYEELGINVKVQEKIIEFDYFYTDKKLHFVVHICKIVSGTPKPLSSVQVKWVFPSELENYSFPAANQKMISALTKFLILRQDKDLT